MFIAVIDGLQYSQILFSTFRLFFKEFYKSFDGDSRDGGQIDLLHTINQVDDEVDDFVSNQIPVVWFV